MKTKRYIHLKSTFILFLAIFLVVSASIFITKTAEVAHADIYKYEDSEGVLHLTNMPSNPDVKWVVVIKEKRILFQPNLDVGKYDHLINKAANKFDLDSALIKAIIKAESNFNHRAVSPVGAQGLMQLMPGTASDMNVRDSFHPESNIEGGARYLKYLLKTYRNNLELALAAYNAGEKAVAKYNYNIPPYRETQNYVRRVLSFYKSYRDE